MAEPFIGEVHMFGGNFGPRGWATCDGQLLPIAQNTPLFALIGTTYGGDGQVTFALPDLRGRVPIHQGTNPANNITYTLGQQAGAETVTLLSTQAPPHSHAVNGSSAPAASRSPAGGVPAVSTRAIYAPPGAPVAMAPGAVGPAGGSQPHNNIMPFQCVNYIIALDGVFPPRS
jgi:microcystin-dependent protein